MRKQKILNKRVIQNISKHQSEIKHDFAQYLELYKSVNDYRLTRSHEEVGKNTYTFKNDIFGDLNVHIYNPTKMSDTVYYFGGSASAVKAFSDVGGAEHSLLSSALKQDKSLITWDFPFQGSRKSSAYLASHSHRSLELDYNKILKMLGTCIFDEFVREIVFVNTFLTKQFGSGRNATVVGWSQGSPLALVHANMLSKHHKVKKTICAGSFDCISSIVGDGNVPYQGSFYFPLARNNVTILYSELAKKTPGELHVIGGALDTAINTEVYSNVCAARHKSQLISKLVLKQKVGHKLKKIMPEIIGALHD